MNALPELAQEVEFVLEFAQLQVKGVRASHFGEEVEQFLHFFDRDDLIGRLCQSQLHGLNVRLERLGSLALFAGSQAHHDLLDVFDQGGIVGDHFDSVGVDLFKTILFWLEKVDCQS